MAVLRATVAQKALHAHLANELLKIFLIALPERQDIEDKISETDTERSLGTRSTLQGLGDGDETILDPEDSEPPSPQALPGGDEAEDEEMNLLWAKVWESPQLSKSVRKTYAGPAHDETLKYLAVQQDKEDDLTKAQMQLKGSVWIPGIYINDEKVSSPRLVPFLYDRLEYDPAPPHVLLDQEVTSEGVPGDYPSWKVDWSLREAIDLSAGEAVFERNEEMIEDGHLATNMAENPFATELATNNDDAGQALFWESVYIINDDAKLFVSVLLDTGSDVNCIDARNVEAWGLSASEYRGPALQGLDGSAAQVLDKVDITLHSADPFTAESWTAEFIVLQDPPSELTLGQPFLKQSGFLERKHLLRATVTGREKSQRIRYQDQHHTFQPVIGHKNAREVS